MKKINVLLFITALILSLVVSTCVSSPGAMSNVPDELDMAIRDASDYLNDNIPAGNMIVILNVQSASRALSNYIIDELIANAVNDRIFSVVDRQQLDLIRTEQNLQLSGEVDDNLAVSIGKFFGAQTIVSGAVSVLGDRYRMSIRALDVETAQVQGQYNRNIAAGRTINDLMRSGGGSIPAIALSGGSSTSSSGSSGRGQSDAIVVEGTTLAEKLQWVEANAANNTEYRLVVTADESLNAPILSYPRIRNVTVRLLSYSGEKTLSLTGNGNLFTIESDVTLILDNGITLQGRNQNNGTLVWVKSRGTLVLNEGAKITGNSTSINGAGVYVDENAIFTMTGGEISGNTTSQRNGGGVYVRSNGNFSMTGGIIYANRAPRGYGGGVYVAGSFTLSGGEIAGNSARGDGSHACSGGGVAVVSGAFTMRGGEIYSNTAAAYNGGGVSVRSGAFSMTGGVISGNSVSGTGSGGGLYLSGGTFTKTGGTIYGSSGDSNANVASRGPAVYISIGIYDSGVRIRNSTAGPEVRLDSSRAGAAGGWEN